VGWEPVFFIYRRLKTGKRFFPRRRFRDRKTTQKTAFRCLSAVKRYVGRGQGAVHKPVRQAAQEK